MNHKGLKMSCKTQGGNIQHSKLDISARQAFCKRLVAKNHRSSESDFVARRESTGKE
jgi:hypothetical protein